MPLLATDAIVLHSFDYLESSRILRLATREAGVQSVLAKGARRSARRFGSALDLFCVGDAQLWMKPGRDLHTLSGFDVTRARPELAEDLGRFTGASALAELVLRFGGAETHAGLYDALLDALDAIGAATAERAADVTLAGAWRLVSELGFGPSLDACSSCHAPLAPDEAVRFSHPAGGALCQECARLTPAGRALPPEARAALRSWSVGEAAPLDEASARAHQRLLREFLREHLADDRPLRAFEAWERSGGAAA